MAKRRKTTRRRASTRRVSWWLLPPLGVLFLVPGMVAVGAVNSLAGLDLYPAQLWTFAVLAAVVFYLACGAVVRSLTGGVGIYAGLSIALLVILLVGVFGFRWAYPIKLVGQYFGVA